MDGRHDQHPSREPSGRTGQRPGPGPRHVVVMGVSGTGKTTVGAEPWPTTSAGPSSRATACTRRPTSPRCRAGVPLDDDDRRPWLQALASLQAFHHAEGISTVLTCSALKRAYRDMLRGGVPAGSASFVHLAAPFEVLRERMESREHFMPASLLQSQLDTLEPLGADEPGTVLDVSAPLAEVVRSAVAAVRG